MPGSMHNISVLWPRSVVAPTRSSNGAAKSACDRTSCCSLLNWEIAHGDGHRALAGDGAEAALNTGRMSAESCFTSVVDAPWTAANRPLAE